MKKFYKIENGKLYIGTGYEVPNGFAEYEDEPQDLKDALETEKATDEANQYKKDRLVEYPTIGDQLDALFHAGVFPVEMAEKIQAVKEKFPKPE